VAAGVMGEWRAGWWVCGCCCGALHAAARLVPARLLSCHCDCNKSQQYPSTQPSPNQPTNRPVDLMFNHPEDSQTIRDARAEILAEIRRWVGMPAPERQQQKQQQQ
jgi:hypothetical protein